MARNGGNPASIPEITAMIEQKEDNKIGIIQVGSTIFNLLRADLIFTDKNVEFFTFTESNDYHSFSYYFEQNMPGYTLDEVSQTVIPKPHTKTVNLERLFEVLKSEDPSLLDEFNFDGEARFLDSSPLTDKVAFCSFPRSGNSLLRRLLEETTGICTGKHMSIGRTTNLQIQGMKGEAIVDSRVWIVGSHHPFHSPDFVPFSSTKVLCVVRDPLDTFYSMFQLYSTFCHSAKTPF
jgi:hypothetical protein